MISAINSTQIKQYPAYSNNYTKDKSSVSFGNQAVDKFLKHFVCATVGGLATAVSLTWLVDFKALPEQVLEIARPVLPIIYVLYIGYEFAKFSKNLHKG